MTFPARPPRSRPTGDNSFNRIFPHQIMNPANSHPDDFRVVDLFSPGEAAFASSAPEGAGPKLPAPRMSGEMPESFLFANPFFAPEGAAQRARDAR